MMKRERTGRPLIEKLWRTPLPTRLIPLWAALTPVSCAYGGMLALRERWWRTLSRHAGVPAISVGNLTVGGNGKTPFTLFLAHRLRAHGINAGIISRGWGGRTGRQAAIVRDTDHILLNVREAGDEPLMMAKSFAGPIAIGRRRIDAIALLDGYLRRQGEALDAVVLDDGFQHLRLQRDLNLLLINTAHGLGNRWLLPAGPMRDRHHAIARADALVMVDGGSGAAANLSAAEHHRLQGKPILHARLEPSSLISADFHTEDLTVPPRWHEHQLALAGRRVAAVSGLADPSGFHAMLQRLGARLAATIAFPDHHDYGPYDIENILTAAAGAELVITTEKDLVKLEYFPLTGLPLYALRVAVTMPPEDEQALLKLALEAIRHSADGRA
jgi:tetraacyldisaccharide 4'-kinase